MASVRLKSGERELRDGGRGRALEMSRGATGWCCLVFWLPTCVAAHGERRRVV